jgi:hypothetical protein
MGGSASEEFLATTEVGEDTFVALHACGYAANTEAVTTPAPAVVDTDRPALTVHDTPDTPTIASLVELANAQQLDGRTDWTAADTLKNVVVVVSHPGDRDDELLVIGVPGDREVDLRRVNAALAPATATMFDDFASRPDLVKGYIGPQDIKIRYLVDPRVVAGTAWLTGANEPGRHATNVVAGRDFTPDGTIAAADVRAGDAVSGVPGGHAHAAPWHRDRAHLPAGTPVHRRVRRRRARRGRQAGAAHHGQLRDRRLPGGGGHRRAAPRRTRPDLAGRRWRRPTFTLSRPAGTGRPRPRSRSAPNWPARACGSWSTTVRCRPASSSPTPS